MRLGGQPEAGIVMFINVYCRNYYLIDRHENPPSGRGILRIMGPLKSVLTLKVQTFNAHTTFIYSSIYGADRCIIQ